MQGWQLGLYAPALLMEDEDGQLQCKGDVVELVAPSTAAKLPQGAKLLKAADTSFIIAPLGHLTEEAYSVYFHFKH